VKVVRAAVAAGAGLVLALALGGCQAVAPIVTPTVVATAPAIDLTAPGAAASMIDRLVKTAGSPDVIMVVVSATQASVTVLNGQTPATWAYRNGQIGLVATDITYVDQSTFDPDDFNIRDVGALFRAAAAVSGSTRGQTLQIVDYSDGRVMMSVSTDPESRTVFFNADGSLLEDLDFDTLGGIQRGLADVVGTVPLAYTVSVQSDQGAWMDYPGSDDGTTTRRQRTPRVPVTTSTRAQRTTLPVFSPALVNADAIWAVVEANAGVTVSATTAWSVTIDQRAGDGLPRMYFSFGLTSVVTDLSGHAVTG